ncbi:MAG: FAD-dependent oxidoreductase [Desulfitobacterium sp.]|nr:FAD-dependent oxidoreductase [Desulfitobacterium sp.]
MRIHQEEGKYYLERNFPTPASLWIDSTPSTSYPSLVGDTNVDVAIIGGGMTGITTAYLLAQGGLKTVVLEAERILLGTTGHTTGKLTVQHNLIYDYLLKQIGEENSKLYAEANRAAIEFVAETIRREDIQCDFSRQSAYLYTQKRRHIKALEKEFEVACKLGIQAYLVEDIPLDLPVKGALRFDNQAQFHPRKYLLALAERFIAQGGNIYEQTKVVDIRGKGPFIVHTESGAKIKADYVIMACHYPFHILPGFYVAKIYQEREYAIVVKAKEKFPGGMYVNVEDPPRSLRGLPTPEEDRILIVGERHRTGTGKNLTEHYKNLMKFAQGLFTVEDFPFHWSTQDCSTLDDIPYIGPVSKDKPNLLMATGYRKWGMTHSTVAALLLRDGILEGKSPWEEVYSPSREGNLKSKTRFVFNTGDLVYHFVGGKLKKGEKEYSLSPGEAVIANIKGRRGGIYKDREGKLHIVDTTCTHLGCELQWNDGELSWDCPCHGSRYDIDGNPLHGPTLKPLKKIRLDKLE